MAELARRRTVQDGRKDMRTRSMKKRRGSRRRGVALLLTLFVFAILAVVVVQFKYSIEAEEAVVENSRDEATLAAAARGSVPWLEALFKDDVKNGKTPATADTLVDDWDDPKLPDARKFKAGDVEVTLEVEDLERRLSLQGLASDNVGMARYYRTALQRLMTRCKVADKDLPKLAAAITDYVRKLGGKGPLDESGGSAPPAPVAPGTPGAPAAPPAKRAIVDLEQLLDVDGMDKKVLYGDPKAKEPTTGIARYLTTWPTSGWNLNTMSDAVLFATLPEKNKNGEQIWGQEDAVIKSIRDYRIDPDQQAAAAAAAGGGAGGGGTGSQPANGQGKGASGQWSGTAFAKIDELESVPNNLLASIYTQKNGTAGGVIPPGSTPPAAPGTGTPPATPATSTDPNAFEYKNGVTVAATFYAVKATATRAAPDGTTTKKIVRFVVARSPQNKAVALLYREDSP